MVQLPYGIKGNRSEIGCGTTGPVKILEVKASATLVGRCRYVSHTSLSE